MASSERAAENSERGGGACVEERPARFPPRADPAFTFIDLFAGIGGFMLAMQDCGGRCVFSSEWNADAQRTYAHNFGETPMGDITLESTKEMSGTRLSAKMCQQGRKGLMSNPNKALGRWLLREVLGIPPLRIVTREMLDVRGFDSVVVVKESEGLYRLELSRAAHYGDFA